MSRPARTRCAVPGLTRRRLQEVSSWPGSWCRWSGPCSSWCRSGCRRWGGWTPAPGHICCSTWPGQWSWRAMPQPPRNGDSCSLRERGPSCRRSASCAYWVAGTPAKLPDRAWLALGGRVDYWLNVDDRGAVERFELADLDPQSFDGEYLGPVQADRVG